jgi:hypothetical protein
LQAGGQRFDPAYLHQTICPGISWAFTETGTTMDLIPGKNFKMKKSTKRMIALMKGTNQQRAEYKKMMIQAQLAAEQIISKPARDSK